MDLRDATIKRVSAVMRVGDMGRCATCGAEVRTAEPHLRLRGAVFHAACAGYPRRGGRTAARRLTAR